MPNIVDVLSGAVTCQLRAGLQQVPLVYPQRLEDFVPATFGGYVASDLVLQQQAAGDPGWGFVTGSATFVWDGTEAQPHVTSMWIIATIERAHYLVFAVPLIGTAAEKIERGPNTITVELAAHVIPPR